MYISNLIATVALASSAIATYSMSIMPSMSMGSESAMMPTATSAAASPSSSGTTPMYIVKVSNKNGDLTYTPNNLSAPVGSLVQFHFYPKNHSVVQAAFSNPCEPINNIMSNVTGFFSGYMPTTANASMMPGFTIQVQDTKPIWYYCSQGKHCQAGMVGVINPPAPSTGKTLDAFTQAAMSVPVSSIPGMSLSNSNSNSGSNYNSSSYSSSGTAPSSFSLAPSASTGIAGANPSSVPFTGSAGSLARIGLGTFVGVGVVLLVV